MHFVVYGAGAIGCTIGARLMQADYKVTLIARGEHARVMRQKGLRFIAPNKTVELKPHVVEHPADVGQLDGETFVLLCMKSQHTADALCALVPPASRDVHVVCVQNGVGNEALALRYFARVYATVVNLPAMFTEPGTVVTQALGRGGILDTGRYPSGLDKHVQTPTAALTEAGFSAHPTHDVMRFKYAKLIVNLGNVFQALLNDQDRARDLLRQARREANRCFVAAGIDCASRDEVKARAQDVYRTVEVEGHERVGGSSWQSLARGNADIETEYLNGEISYLGRMYGVETPVNDACVQLARRSIQENRPAQSFGVDDLLQIVSNVAGANS